MRDLGGMEVPINGALRDPPAGDGVAVVGEALWIRGGSFGRQPSVLVAGRPAAVLSRTGDGGILTRVPVGTPAGHQRLVVKNENGQAERPLEVRRYAGVLSPSGNHVSWLAVGTDAPVIVGRTDVADARFLRVSADGRAAYVAGSNGVLTILELPAARQPAIAGTIGLGPERIVALTTAASAHVAAVVRESDFVLFDTSSPLRPVRRPPVALPSVLKEGRVIRAELSPDGRQIAFALAERNRLVLLDVARPGDQLSEVALAPEVRAPIITDLSFAHDGRTLWAVAGETGDSRQLGPQPTRVFALRVKSAAGWRSVLELARTVEVSSAAGPSGLTTARTLPLASGLAVRLPPEKATVFLSATVRDHERSAVFSIGSEDSATEIASVAGGNCLGRLDASPEGRHLLAAATGGGSFRVLSVPADGRGGEIQSVPLEAGTGPIAGQGGEVRIQP